MELFEDKYKIKLKFYKNNLYKKEKYKQDESCDFEE